MNCVGSGPGGAEGKRQNDAIDSWQDARYGHQLLAVLLGFVSSSGQALRDARQLVGTFGNLRSVLDADPQDLTQLVGVAPRTLQFIRVVRDVVLQYAEQRAAERELLTDRQLIANFWRLRIGSLRDEVAEVALLDGAFRLLPEGVVRISEGTVDRVAIYPRRVIETALRRGAAALVLAHNHPNGSVQPSEMDRLLTRAIVLGAEAVSLRVVDHLIVSPDETFSFRTAGLL